MSKKGQSEQPPPLPPFDTTAEGRAAIAAYDEGDYVGALKCIKNSESRYRKCPFYQHAKAFILYKIALQNNDHDGGTVRNYIEEAAMSALQASFLLSSSTIIAYFCACALYDLASFNREYYKVIRECNRALGIENPMEPERSSFVFKDPSQEWGIEKTKQELRELMKKSERKKRWAAISSVETIQESIKAAVKRVDEIKNQLARLRDSPEEEEMEPKLEERRKKQFADKFMVNLEKGNVAKSFWNNELSAEQKRSLFRVKIEELKKHLTNRKEKDLLSEAIEFAKAHRSWKFWECCDCSEKYGDWQSYMQHLCDFHDLRIHQDLASIHPKIVDEDSREMIFNGEWKPVDTEEAIKILENQSKSESYNTDDSYMRAEKGQGEYKGCSDEDVLLTKQLGSESDKEASSIAPTDWPLSDDNKRIALLESLHGTFQFLLRYSFLIQVEIDEVIKYAVAMLKTRFSDSHLRNLGPETLKLVCFLESSQLNSIIHKLQHVAGTLSENTGIGNSTDEQLTGARTFDIKEDVVLNDNSSYLILDGVLSYDTHIVSWLYLGHEVGEAIKLWARLRESNRGQRVKLFESFKMERSKFVKMYEERWKLSKKWDALEAVNGIFADEKKRRDENPEYVWRTFESLLRERLKELEERIDAAAAAYQFELEFILNVLETDRAVAAYQFENTSRVHENWNQSDEYVGEKILSWTNQLGNDIWLENVRIITSIVSMKLFNLQLGEISAYEYQLILLPMFRSLVKSRLERHIDEEAVKKLNEIQKGLEEPDNKGQTQGKSKNKKNKNKNKKRKDQREAKDFGVTRDIEQPLETGDTEQPSETGDMEQPSATRDIEQPSETGDIKQPSLPQEKAVQIVDDMQQSIATENAEKKSNEKEKSLEETDSKRQTRGKSKNKKNKNKKRKYQGEHADFSATGDIERPLETGDIEQPSGTGDIQQTSETGDIEQPSLPQEKAVQNDNPNSEKDERADDLQQSIATDEKLLEENVKYQLQSEHEARLNVNVLGTGLGKEAANNFLYMIIQSLWNLREFQEECKKKLDEVQKHDGNPCIVCAFFDICAAKNRGEAVDPTELRIALSTYYCNQNNFQEGQVNDAYLFLLVIFKVLHVAFYAVNSDDKPEDMYKDRLHCVDSNCLVHRIFGMDIFESIECINCHMRSGYQKCTYLSFGISANNLRSLKNEHMDMSSKKVLELTGLGEQMTCGCGQLNSIYHSLWRLPHVFVSVIDWRRGDKSSEDISTTLSALSNELDLSKLFQGYLPDYTYFVVSMVCFCKDRQHSVCFLYDDQHDEHYVQHSDSNVEFKISPVRVAQSSGIRPHAESRLLLRSDDVRGDSLCTTKYR
ncbi:USP domain-containing protein [Citrus sinensis]|uniref:USP domain-containing protein n=1 Tax=Citrus sinensis TaxID=2711 RepID=A0ACB8LZH8_CITSI|nr:USP domain-containing protein [Citrus sinensis]